MQTPAEWAGGALTAVLGMLLLSQHTQATVATTCAVPNCDTCQVSALECTTCNNVGLTNYWLRSGSCLQCPSNCAECSSNSACGGTATCTKCKDGYYMNGNICSACSGQCATCNSLTNCLTCNTNWYPSSTCNVPCGSPGTNCAVCASTGTCTTCNNGYYKVNGVGNCVGCPHNCKICGNTGLCTQCNDGFYPDATGATCNGCPPGCKTCSEVPGHTLRLCDTCLTASTYFMQWAGGQGLNPQCRMCPQNCAQCNEIGDCDTCMAGYYSQGGACLQCQGSGRCLSCSNAGSGACQTCMAGYSGATCTAITCHTDCEPGMCMSGSMCSKCKLNYFLESPNTCTACFRASSTQCNACHRADIGYFYNTASSLNICQRCPDHCLTCSSLTMCTKCVPGYDIDPGTNLCTTMLTCSPPTALTMNTCEKCSGTFWNTVPATDICEVCPTPTGAATALSVQTQLSCPRCGGVWEPSCQTVSGCSTSSLVNQCTACTGYYFDAGAGACKDCATTVINSEADCANCKDHFKDSCNYVDCNGPLDDAANPIRCHTCVGRKWVAAVGSTPAACHGVNCHDKSLLLTQDDCEACPGAFFDNAATPKCAACSANCLKCTSATVCTECMDGHAMTGASSCEATPLDCRNLASLDSQAKCNACPGGKWTVSSAACTIYTWADCDAVTSDPDECKACRLYGFHMDDSGPPAACVECGLLDDAAACTRCKSVRYDSVVGKCAATVYGQEPGSLFPSHMYDFDTIDASPVNCLQRMIVYDTRDSVCSAVRDCELANMKTELICEACGFAWDTTGTPTCVACTAVANCADCRTDKDACDVCEAGYRLDAVPPVACTEITDCATTTVEADCNACVGKWWNSNLGAAGCTDQNDDTGCVGSDSEARCRACEPHGTFYWDAGNSECKQCGSSVNLHAMKDGCLKCTMTAAGAARATRWDASTHTCKVKTTATEPTGWVGQDTTCSGLIGDSNECSFCTGRKWNAGAGECEAVDCRSPPSVEADCMACPNMVWDSAAVPSVCKWCPENCEMCDTAAECLRCMDGFIILDSGACEREPLEDVCSDTLSYSTDPVKDAQNCLNCPGHWYDTSGPACPFITETDCGGLTGLTSLDEDKCWACRIYGYIWDAATGCEQDCVADNELTSERRCTKCPRVKWMTTGTPSCRANEYNHPRNVMLHKGFGVPVTPSPFPMDAGSCMGAELYWQSTCEPYPTACGVVPSMMSMKECARCLDYKWVNGGCEAVTCTSSSDMADCDRCSDWFWDTTSDPSNHVCREIATSTCSDNDQPYQNQERCDKCNMMGDYLWEDAVGTCKACTATLRPTTCKSMDCPGRWYDHAEANPLLACKAGPANCMKTSADGTICEWCNDGMTWVTGTGCVSCVSDTAEECDSCRHRVQQATSSANLISYWDTVPQAATDDCYDCPATDTMYSCHRCNDRTKYWNTAAAGGASCESCGGAACATCTSNGCTSCSQGYYPGTPAVGQTHIPCMACGTGCLQCTDSGCTMCDSATHCLNGNTCSAHGVTLEAGCKICYTDPAGALKCLECQNGHYLRRCDECDDVNCMQCTVSSSACTQCRAGYRLTTNGCIACSATDGPCTTCNDQPMANTPFVCTACTNDQYALDTNAATSDTMCAACTDVNCDTCPNSKSVCTQCDSGYYISSTGTCALCSSAIASCRVCQLQNSSVVCQTCIDGFGLLNGACSSCQNSVSNCGACQGVQTCAATGCAAGYVYDSNTGGCVPGCYTCSGWECIDKLTHTHTTTPLKMEACPGLVDGTAKCAIHVWRYTHKHLHFPVWTERKCETDLTKCVSCNDHGKDVIRCAMDNCCTTAGCNMKASAAAVTPAVVTLLCVGLLHLLLSHTRYAPQ